MNCVWDRNVKIKNIILASILVFSTTGCAREPHITYSFNEGQLVKFGVDKHPVMITERYYFYPDNKPLYKVRCVDKFGKVQEIEVREFELGE
jgi:hypothetical protein